MLRRVDSLAHVSGKAEPPPGESDDTSGKQAKGNSCRSCDGRAHAHTSSAARLVGGSSGHGVKIHWAVSTDAVNDGDNDQ